MKKVLQKWYAPLFLIPIGALYFFLLALIIPKPIDYKANIHVEYRLYEPPLMYNGHSLEIVIY
jgi:hypothetical protein